LLNQFIDSPLHFPLALEIIEAVYPYKMFSYEITR